MCSDVITELCSDWLMPCKGVWWVLTVLTVLTDRSSCSSYRGGKIQSHCSVSDMSALLILRVHRDSSCSGEHKLLVFYIKYVSMIIRNMFSLQ